MTHRRGRQPLQLLLVALALILAWTGQLLAQSQGLPPKPDRYITDQAGVMDAASVEAINQQLEKFERDTSNQIVVAIYPTLPPDAEIAQYATDTYNAWGIGQKNKDNGALLLVFVQSRKLFICTGRGLEGPLPDAICKRIITQIITPRFKQGDYNGGIQAGVNAILAGAKGEFQGNGKTVADSQDSDPNVPAGVIILIIIIFIVISLIMPRSGGGPFIFTGGGFGGGGGYGGSGGGGFGGGGGFSGGGGSSAGGGAGGSW